MCDAGTAHAEVEGQLGTAGDLTGIEERLGEPQISRLFPVDTIYVATYK